MKQTKKNEILLLLGKWTSKMGDILFDYINSISIVSSYTQAPIVLALYQSGETIVNVFFNIMGGALADRGTKKNILVITDFISGLICLILCFFLQTKHMAIALICSNALLAFVFSFNSPTYKAITRQLVLKERISLINSISHTGNEFIKVIGPFCGIILIERIGIRGAMLIDAVSFFVSAILETQLQPIISETEVVNYGRTFWTDIFAGFRYLATERSVLLLISLSAFVNFYLSGYNLLVPYTSVIYAQQGDNFYSKVMFAQTLGGISGSLVNIKLFKEKIIYAKTLTSILMATGMPLILIPSISYSCKNAITLLPFYLFYVFLTLFNINFISYVQTSVLDEFQGRVFSIIFTIAVIFMPIGSLFFSSNLDFTSNVDFRVIGYGISGLAAFVRIVLAFGNKETKRRR